MRIHTESFATLRAGLFHRDCFVGLRYPRKDESDCFGPPRLTLAASRFWIPAFAGMTSQGRAALAATKAVGSSAALGELRATTRDKGEEIFKDCFGPPRRTPAMTIDARFLTTTGEFTAIMSE